MALSIIVPALPALARAAAPIVIPAVATFVAASAFNRWQKSGGMLDMAVGKFGEGGRSVVGLVGRFAGYTTKAVVALATLVISMAPAIISFILSSVSSLIATSVALGGFIIFSIILPLAKKTPKQKSANTLLVLIGLVCLVSGVAFVARQVHTAQLDGKLPSPKEGRNLQQTVSSIIPFKLK